MQVYMLNPLVNKNKTIMHVIGQSEKCYASIIEHLLERKYLVPALVEAGIIPMIENTTRTYFQLPADTLDKLKKIESESKSITEGHNNRRLSYLKHVSLQPLDKAQLLWRH
jgi:predicted nucleic-acid-binding protein